MTDYHSKPTTTRLATPDLTPAQGAALASSAVAQLIAWGLISSSTGSLLVSIAGIVLPAVWAVADAIIRHGRATGNATR